MIVRTHVLMTMKKTCNKINSMKFSNKQQEVDFKNVLSSIKHLKVDEDFTNNVCSIIKDYIIKVNKYDKAGLMFRLQNTPNIVSALCRELESAYGMNGYSFASEIHKTYDNMIIPTQYNPYVTNDLKVYIIVEASSKNVIRVFKNIDKANEEVKKYNKMQPRKKYLVQEMYYVE